MFKQNRIDGGIFVGFPNNHELIDQLADAGYVIGVFNQHNPRRDVPNRAIVRLTYNSVDIMVNYAASLGHRDIMFIGGDMVRQSGVDICQLFRDALTRNGLPVNEDFILCAQAFTKTHAVDAFSRFMKQSAGSGHIPTCVVAGNDIMALGVIDVLRQYGLRVPEDVSVAGSDDILVAQYFDPPLTTIRYDFDEMMKTLTVKVLEYLQSPFDSPFVQEYSGELVIRKSCMIAGNSGGNPD
jgi:LacI family transcriptional regulator